MSCRLRSSPVSRRSAALLGIFPLFLLLAAKPAVAQTPTEKIREFAVTASGFVLREEVEEGSLEAGSHTAFPLDLQAGMDYVVVGFCVDDCTDLDLAILGPSGAEMEADRLPDAQPVLIFTPEIRGRYQVQVEMVACSVDPCLYAVGTLEGSRGDDLGPPGETMEDRLNVFRSDLVLEGYTEVGPPETGGLDEGQEIRFSVSLMEGADFKFVGVCDNDCENLDLILYDPDGGELASDRLGDPFPLVSFAPTATEEYRLAARMMTCTVEPCGFAVATFVSGEGIGPGGVPLSGTPVMRDTHQGTLEEGDELLEEGEYVDRYTIQARAGQTIIADLRSPDFDTYVILNGPGEFWEENDDWADDTMHSHIEMVAPESGTYFVLVTTFLAGETGEYTLQLAVVEGS